MKRRIISLGIAFVMFCSIMGTTAFAIAPEQNNSLGLIEAFVMNQVEAFSAIDDAWDETTEIKNYVVLYAPDDTVNGYIFRFETCGVDTGFMQIGIQGQEFYVVNLGFEGADVLSKMVEYHNSLTESSLTMMTEVADVPTVNLLTSPKVYYTGGFNYYLYGGENELVSLFGNEVVETGLADLEPEYSLYKENRVEAMEEIESECAAGENTRSSTIENYTVTGYYDASTYMKTMSYWSNYDQHCTPTAATNYVMYWKYGRGLFANHTASLSQTNVFNWFYQKMQTNQSIIGTNWNNIWPAYKEYFTNYSGASALVSDRVILVNFSGIKMKLNADMPVHLEVIDYEGIGNHSVNVWGYSIVNSNQYLRITDNWGTTIGNILIDYGSYNYGQYVYYGITS